MKDVNPLPEELIGIAKANNIKLQKMPVNFEQMYVSPKMNRIRCVDERILTEEYKDFDTNPQIPGNDWALVDVVRTMSALDEKNAFALVEETLNSMGFSTTMHEHCGYLNLSSQEPSPLGIPTRNKEERKKLAISEKSAQIENYIGEHVKGAKALLNSIHDSTFNTRLAHNSENPAFNLDYWFALRFGEAIKERTLKSGEEFANEVGRLYFRTIKALTHQKQAIIYYR